MGKSKGVPEVSASLMEGTVYKATYGGDSLQGHLWRGQFTRPLMEGTVYKANVPTVALPVSGRRRNLALVSAHVHIIWV